MSIDLFLPFIKAKLKTMYKESYDIIDNLDLSELTELTKSNLAIHNNFIPILEPNKYMKSVYVFFALNHAGSSKYFVNRYVTSTRSKKKLLKDSIRKYHENELEFLCLNGLVRKQILPYTLPKPTCIYIAPYASKVNIQKAIDLYPYEEAYEIQKTEIKKTIYKGKEKEAFNKEKIFQEAIQEAATKEIKTQVNNLVQKSKSFVCSCGIQTIDLKTLKAHWQEKKFYVKGEFLCRECREPWGEREPCPHNCEFEYRKQRGVLDKWLDGVSDLLDNGEVKLIE